MTGVGNYFRATLGLHLRLSGRISVKKANFKLKNGPLRAGCGPQAVCCPLLLYGVPEAKRLRNSALSIPSCYFTFTPGLLIFGFLRLAPFFPRVNGINCERLKTSTLKVEKGCVRERQTWGNKT